ncbi:hypothetical protein KPP03845_200237 (plasmid) [Streptomyces xanthophaeus]|nr:hypothetical protein KPP03845_200237 [Streptomyces xanthophaeus]
MPDFLTRKCAFPAIIPGGTGRVRLASTAEPCPPTDTVETVGYRTSARCWIRRVVASTTGAVRQHKCAPEPTGRNERGMDTPNTTARQMLHTRFIAKRKKPIPTHSETISKTEGPAEITTGPSFSVRTLESDSPFRPLNHSPPIPPSRPREDLRPCNPRTAGTGTLNPKDLKFELSARLHPSGTRSYIHAPKE